MPVAIRRIEGASQPGSSADARQRRPGLLRRRLDDSRYGALQALWSLRDTLSADAAGVKDDQDVAVDDGLRETQSALAEIASETLHRIEEAMRRLDAGGYGRCGDCGVPIGRARLRVLPFATLCRACQGLRERREPGDVELRAPGGTGE